MLSAKARLCDFIFYMGIGVLYAFALTRAVFDATVFELTDKDLLMLCAGFLLALYIVLFNTRTILVSLGAFAVAGIVVYVSLRSGQFEARWYVELVSHLRELLEFLRDRGPYREQFSGTLLIIVCGATALVTALCMRPRFNFALMAAAGAAVMIIPVNTGWSESAATMPLYLFCVLALLVKRLNLGTVKRESGHMRQNAVFALAAVPLCVMASVTAWAIPKPANLPQADLSDTIETPRSIFDAADEIFGGTGLGSGSRTLSYTSDGARLGGPNTLGNQLVMEVFCDERVYLAGSVREDYTGYSWQSASRERVAVQPDENNVYNASEYSAEDRDRQDYHRRFYAQNELDVTVNVLDNRTVTVFTPPFTRDLYTSDIPNGSHLMADGSGALTFERALPPDSSYTQSFIAWNYTNRYIIELLRSADTSGSSQDMSAYLTLPDSLPERVRELAADVTANESTDYDKLIALSRYLSSFPYTLSPESVPRSEDFVDYFLFTGKEGYCVYYASALAALARCEGIPTRYVEGFVMPQSRNPDGSFTVTGQQAHAWAEAYFPDFGWVIIEATPPDYAGNSNLAAAPELSEAGEAPATPQLPESEPETEAPDSRPSGTPPDPITPQDTQSDKEATVPFAIKVIAVILCILAAAIFAAQLRFKRRTAALASLTNRDAARTSFSRLLGAAAALGFPPLPNETAHAWAARTGDSLPLPEDASAPVLADIFARAAYSGHEITSRERHTMESACSELLSQLQTRRRGPLASLTHLWNRYALLRY